MTKHPQQEQITNTEWIIDLEKFDNRIEKYVSKDTFCTFSSMDLKDTLDEIRAIVYNCIERRERSRTHTHAAPAERKLTVVEDITFEGAAIVQAARKDERELSKKMYSLMMCVKKENTDEFMEYYESRMHEFEESLRGGATQQGGERR